MGRAIIVRRSAVNEAPGSPMACAGTGFDLLSKTIEEVSARSFNELLNACITSRPGMEDTMLLKHDAEIAQPTGRPISRA